MSNPQPLKVFPQGEREIVFTRGFDAPRELVFDAMTKPHLVKRWMGPRGWNLVTCEIDLRVGGKYRYVGKRPNGPEMGWGGVFREVTRPSRLICTEAFDDPWYPGECVITTTFEEKEGMTLMTAVTEYVTAEARDAVLKSPMESGVRESYARLDEVLAESGRKS
ncbi:MAG TPA: SRPBCC family protein [Thermoanaerobaculia bacterium]|jgi:uncharacterized protein YndB with AHSA1/START domain